MKTKFSAIIIVLLAVAVQGCDLSSRPPRAPAPCSPDLCQYPEVGYLPIENLGHSTLYIRYGYGSNGENPPASMQRTEAAAQSFRNIAFQSTLYHHLYFYSDAGFTQEIGQLVLFNNNPVYSPMCKVRVRPTGEFTSQEALTRVSNTRTKMGMRYAQLYTSGYWLQDNMLQKNFRQCQDTLFATSQSTMFHHFYFYSRTGSEAHETNALSKVIYKNTNAAKINLPSITLK